MIRFAVGFTILIAAYYALAVLPGFDSALYVYLEANARIAGAILRACGQGVEVAGVTVRSGPFAISLRRGCDAIEPAWFFCAAVAAFPVPWRRKRLILPVGTALLLGLNLVRVVSLFYVGKLWPGLYGPVHLEVWPAAFMIAVVALWLAWMRLVKPAPGLSPNADA
jgi:exosortase H (IPTLxxWG-CTERM-specific)